MRQSRRTASAARNRLVGAAAVALIVPGTRALHAQDFGGAYLGAAIGLAQVDANIAAPQGGLDPTPSGEFQGNQLGFKVVAGIRPIAHVGGEFEYVDFGRASGSDFGFPAKMSQKGPAAFAVFYLPMPAGDLYAKLGVASLQNSFSGSAFFYSSGSPCQWNSTYTGGAAGLGAQFKIGACAIRAEYERFSAGGANPSLLSIGALWRFL
jgi:hypothetical protein